MVNKNHTIAIFLITLFTFIGFMPTIETVNGQEGEPDYYYVGDRKISLAVSDAYKAFAMKSGLSPASRSGFEASVRAAGVAEVEQSPILEQYGIVLIRPRESVGRSTFRSGMATMSMRTEVQAEVPVYSIGNTSAVLVNEFLIQFQSEVSESQINEFLNENNVKVVQKKPKISNRYTVTFEGKSPREALSLSNTIHQNEIVTFSEPNFVTLLPSRPNIKSSGPTSSAPSPSSTTPNDQFFSQQWGLHNTGSGGIGVPDADIDAPEAFDKHKGDQSIVVAIVDEGVDTEHPDLQAKIVTPYDAMDGDDNQEPNSWDGHGTACAGIAAAVTNNSLGVAGVGWNIKIMPIRIASSNCRGCDWMTSNAIIEDGLRTAVDRGAHVLSNSWGGGSPSNAINSAIDYAISNNRVVVIAAGNDAGPVSYPADLSTNKDVIAVSATNEWDALKSPTSLDGEDWWGSNFGPEINIAAPGVHIYTTDISGADGYVNGDYVSNFNGTSSATPFVAGAAALVMSQNPTMTPAQVRDRLQNSADDLGTPGFDNQFGHGRLNVAEALTEGSPTTVATPDVVNQPQSVAEAGIVAVGLTVGMITTEPSTTVSEGNVISQNPTAGSQVALNSPVDLRVSGPAEAMIPISPPPTKGVISVPGMVNLFQFQVTAQGSYTIETRGISDSMDTVVALFGPNSETTLINENDDIGNGNRNSRIIETLSPGTYILKVRHYFSTQVGEYTITVQATN